MTKKHKKQSFQGHKTPYFGLLFVRLPRAFRVKKDTPRGEKAQNFTAAGEFLSLENELWYSSLWPINKYNS